MSIRSVFIILTRDRLQSRGDLVAIQLLSRLSKRLRIRGVRAAFLEGP